MAFNSQENNIAFQTAESGLASINISKMTTCSAPESQTIQSVTYASGRVTRALVTVTYDEVGDLDVKPGSPITGRYDITSTATLEPAATTAAAIEDNTHSLHRRGYRCLGFN
ncbi:hypothetical protein Pres01_01020 [Metapseudomonas resinovorans]|nr:hypothetical protein Pres01_01020 [Pseudomonas resinovorans]